MTQPTLYTIGHSNQTFEDLLKMLQTQHINVIVDVRSVPASKYTPQSAVSFAAKKLRDIVTVVC